MHSFSTDDDENDLLDIDFDDVAFGESAIDDRDGNLLIRWMVTGFGDRPLAIESFRIQRAGEQ